MIVRSDWRAGVHVMWDAAEYLRFSEERSRPFADLLTQVRRADARFIADLGCGTGNLTRTLAQRWPSARVVGVLDVAEQEATEDIQKIGGMEALDAPYLDVGYFRMIWKRGAWL